MKADILSVARKGFRNVRVYSTECNTLEVLGEACKAYGIKMIIGVFFKGSTSSGDTDLEKIISWSRWELVELVVIGNESIFSGLDAHEVASYIASAKDKLHAAGCTATITTAETVNIYESHGPTVCPVLDAIGVNIQPYFDGGRSGMDSGLFVLSQIDLVKNVCPGKDVLVLEAGWPSAGGSNSKAMATHEEQKAAIRSIRNVADLFTSFFTWENDGWKAEDIERNFGCGHLF